MSTIVNFSRERKSLDAHKYFQTYKNVQFEFLILNYFLHYNQNYDNYFKKIISILLIPTHCLLFKIIII